MRSVIGILGGTLLFFGIARQGCAGIYDPALLCPFDFDKSGRYALALPYENFAILFNKYSLLRGILPNRDREILRKSVHDLLTSQNRTLDDNIKLTASQLELGEHDQALEILLPLSRDPTVNGDASGKGFIIYAHLCLAHLGQDSDRSELSAAKEAEQVALSKDFPFPQHFADLTPAQLDWLHKVEKDYVLPWLRRRVKEGKPPPHTLAPLFCHADGRPVRLVCADGVYRAKEISAEEKSLLPPDAIAIVQQMLLWNPSDTRMLWLLGELYNAAGEVQSASKIFQICIESRGFSPPELVQHRKVLLSFIDEQQRRTAEQEQQKRLAEDELQRQAAEDADRLKKEAENSRLREKQHYVFIGLVAALVVVLLGYFQVRELLRRMRRRAEPR